MGKTKLKEHKWPSIEQLTPGGTGTPGVGITHTYSPMCIHMCDVYNSQMWDCLHRALIHQKRQRWAGLYTGNSFPPGERSLGYDESREERTTELRQTASE
jgi:hypothetical protein